MYFWSAKKLAYDLDHHKVKMLDRLGYSLFALLQFLLHISIFNALPTLYYVIFSYIKYNLEELAQYPTLIIHVYSNVDQPLTNIFFLSYVAMLGLLLFVYLRKIPFAHRVERLIALNTPITIRVLTVALIFFCALLGYIIFSFAIELIQLVQTPTAERGLVNFLWRFVNHLNIVGKVWKAFVTLKQAELIFARINDMSWFFYIGSYITSLICGIGYCMLMYMHGKPKN